MRSRPGAARLLLVALTAPLAAAPAVAQPWTEPDPAAVVGQWRGPVRWQRCAIDGAARVALAVGRDGSGYQIDLAALADGWGVEAMAPLGGDLLEGNRADVRVAWRAGKPGRATLTVTLGSGCVATASLTRASIGAPPCDELAALATIAERCDALAPPAVDVGPLVARLRTQRPQGARRRGGVSAGGAAAARRADRRGLRARPDPGGGRPADRRVRRADRDALARGPLRQGRGRRQAAAARAGAHRRQERGGRRSRRSRRPGRELPRHRGRARRSAAAAGLLTTRHR
jgi:hypothetical protein